MTKFLPLSFLILFNIFQHLQAQCPPPGFPEPGNTCPQAPVLCDNIDGYCATVNNNNVVQPFPGCPANVLNNDEWFAFFAGTTSITLQITPSNCQQSGNMGLQGGIYGGCINQIMDLQCPCEEDPFELSANNFVIGEIYYLVIDGCAGNVCDYTVNVLSGSTVPFPPDNPGPITGPAGVCVNESENYSIAPPNGATGYDWTLVPALGTINGDDEDISINWGNTPGIAELCVQVSNQCESNPNLSCFTIEVFPEPSATLTGTGEVCENGASNPVDLTIEFTGTPPWTFEYMIDGVVQPPITTSTNPYILQVTDPGDYELVSIISSAGECEGTVSGNVEITETQIDLTLTTETATCSLSNGDVGLTVSGGATPYQFIWSNGATTEDLADVPPGTYTVTVTDANGCTEEAAATVDDTPNEPSVSATTTSSICGEANGSIDVSVSGGDSPYTYAWDNGATTEDLTDVEAGTYVITVTGADGCTTELTVSLGNEDPPININGIVEANTTCIGGNGSIDITINPAVPPAGGTYGINWSNGAATTSITDLVPGTYTVTVTNGTSCEGTASFTIPDEPNEPEISSTTDPSLCELDNGSIDITVSGGVSPYTYIWSNGATTEDLSNILSGTYTVTVTGANGCTSESAITLDNENPPININPVIDPNTGCGAGNWNGSISISIAPAVPPVGGSYTINWNTGAMTTTISNLEPGSYTVTVNGGGACETIATFTIPDQPNEPQINPSVINSTCGLSNGSASISISGGVQPYVINWSNGATTNAINNVPAGNYAVTVTGANGCSSEAPVNIGDNPISFTVTPVINPNTACDPNDYDGSITLTVNPPGTYTINWANGATTNSISDLAPGNYSVTVSAGGNCEQVLNFSVPNNPNVPVIGSVITPATCGLSNGSALVSITFGLFPMTFNWSNGFTGQSLSNVPAGSYSVTVTSDNGCTATTTATIPNEEIPIDINGIVMGNTSCIPGAENGSIDITVTTTGTPVITWSNGASGTSLSNLSPGTYSVTVSVGGNCEESQSFTVPDDAENPSLTTVPTPSNCGEPDGEADLNVTGGVSPYTYFWSNGATTEDITGVLAGTYTVTVTSATGCSSVSSVTIPDNTVNFDVLPIITGNTNCIIPNGSIQLQVTPPGNYSYQWATGQNTSFLANLPAGSYSVTVSAGGTCEVIATYTVFEFAFPPNASVTTTAATCGLANGSVNLTVTGGADPFTFEWSNGATTEDLTGVEPGTYSVTVTNQNDCTTTAQATVGNNTVPINISGNATPNTSCSSSNGAVDISASPAGTYDYVWSNGATSQDLTGLPAGTYTVTVTSGGSCSSTATYTVANNTEDPEVAATITAAICGESNGAIDLSVSGATAPYTFAWSGGPTTEDLTGIPSGDYTVTVTGANGCTAEETFNVADNSSNFSLDAVVTPLSSCVAQNGGVDLTVTPAGNYDILWSNNQTSEDLTGLAAGTYTVTVTESGSCSATASFIVADQTTTPSVSQIVTAEICGQEDGAIDLTVMGGATPYTFLWSSGATTEDLTGLIAGSYTVTVTGANGCSVALTIEVPENSISIAADGITTPNTSCDINNGSIDLTVSPPGSYTFEWSNGANTEDISGLTGGTYSVVVSAGGDCTASASFTVASTTEDPLISQTIQPAICGENNGGINLTISGGATPYSYEWSNGATTEDLTGILSGSYSVVVTGANGCAANASFTVPNNSIVFTLTAMSQPNSSCDNANGSIDLTVDPSGTAYTYNWSNGATTEDLSGLTPGSYSVTVYQGASCESTATFNVANNTNAPDFSEMITASICGQPNGAIDLTVTDGVEPLTFIWSSNETTEDLIGLLSGTYEVTVTDALGCTATGSYNVPNNSNTFNLSATTTPNTLCGDGNGTIDLTLDPPGSYGITWSNGAATEDLSGLSPGTYTVTVSDAGTCTASASFTVENDAPTIDVSGVVTDVVCFGGNTGEIVVTVNGGIAPYTFEWTPGITGDPQNPVQCTPGDYAVTVTDASGCTGEATFEVGQPTSGVEITCAQTGSVSAIGAMDGEATVNITGGTAPYSVQWTPGGSQVNVPAGDFLIDALGAGSYGVVVTDDNGCETTCQFTINPGGCVTEVGTMSGDLLEACGEDCLTANYDQLGQFLEPDDVLQFILHTGSSNTIQGEIARSAQPEFCFDPAAMNYEVTYYISAAAGNDDGSGNVDLTDLCTVVSFGTPIVFHEIPEAQVEDPDPITCQVPVVDLTGSSSIPGSTFLWSTMDGQLTGGNTGPVVQAGAGGTYMLVVQVNGCTDTVFVVVEDLATGIDASITADPGELIDCTIEQVALVGAATGAVNPQFTWTFNNAVISTNVSVIVDEGGVYTLTVYDPVSDCTDVVSIQIEDNTDFPPLFTDIPPVLNCQDTVVTLSGGSLVGGVSFYWATITGTDTTIIGQGSSLDVTSTGTYYLVGTAGNGCINSAALTVTGNFTPPDANAGADQSLDCYLTPVNLEGSSSTSNVDFFWTVNDPDVLISNPDAPIITVGEPGVYTLTVTQLDNNCQAIDEVVVDLYENVPQGVLDIEPPSCAGDADGVIMVEVDPAFGPYEFSLNGVSNGGLNFFAPLASGTYILQVTDGQGCTWTTEAVLPEPAPFDVNLGADTVVLLGESVTLRVVYTVPASQLDTILWTPESQFPCDFMPCDEQVFIPVQQQSVGVTVIDTNGCQASDLLNVFVRKERKVYIPNAFSPNGDGVNDRFTIYASDEVVQVKSFLVFSRWGETVYEYYDFEPNNPAEGWDGQHRGEPMNPAVFSWFAVITFIDGEEVLFEGDVTLVR